MMQFLTRSLVVAWGVMFSLGTPAQVIGEMGTLVFLNLPERSVVRVEGNVVQLEAGERRGQYLQYPAGRSIEIQVTTPSGVRAVTVAGVDVGATTTVQFRESEFRPPRAALALLAPGVPQVSAGRPVAGSLVMVGLAGAVGGTVWAGGQLRDAQADADVAAASYARAMTEPDAIAAREAHGQAVSEAVVARNARAAFALAGVAVYVIGAADALIRHTSSAGLEASTPRWPIVAFDPSQREISLRVRL